MNEKDLKLTDLDYAVGSHHLQMLKAALPYMGIPEQRSMSLFIKWNELMRTMDFFKENEDGMLSVCSLDKQHNSPVDMLQAIKPYASQREQDMIDMISSVSAFSGTMGKGGSAARGRGAFPLEQILSMMPPEQQTRFETLQMMMQAFGQF